MERRGQVKREFSFEPGLHALERLCEKNFGTANSGEEQGKTRVAGTEGRNVQLRRTSPRNSEDGAGLRDEMALLRNEVSALTKAVAELAVQMQRQD
jgi:hypothetical protein